MSDSEEEAGSSVRPGNPGHLDNQDLPSLFWDTMPENVDEHPDYIAMQALAEESTPEERAENFKVQGNNKLKVGLKSNNKLLLREAIAFYDKGLDLKCSDPDINVALQNNKAHVNSLLANWRSALQDSEAALQVQPDNIKAIFRGARAACKLGEWDKCSQLVEGGMRLEPGAPELLLIQEEAAKAQQEQQKTAMQLEAARLEAAVPAMKLAHTLSAKGYQLTTPQVRVGARRPHVDDEGAVHWPVLLMYPETMQQDVVEDWHEGDCLADHLDVMFGPDAPPLQWDRDQEYTRDRVELYYLSNAGKPLTQKQLAEAMQGKWPTQLEDAAAVAPERYGTAAPAWVKADERQSLGQVLLQPGHVVPGVPLFWVVANDTDYKKRFLAQGAK